MVKKMLISALMVSVMAGTVFAQGGYSKKSLQFVDEFGQPVNMGTSVSLYIYNAGTTNQQTCYLSGEGTAAVTQPVTDDSTNTALSYTTGVLSFWSKPVTFKIVVTDGTYTRTVDNLTASDGRIAWPSYLTAMSGYALSDSDDLSFGTDTDWAMDCDVAGRLDAIPAADGAVFAIGSATYQSDVYMYAASDQYFLWDEGNSRVAMVKSNILLDDNSDLVFGSDSDFAVDSDTAATLDITPLATDESPIINVGANTSGIDFKLFAATTADYVLWDASDEQFEFIGTQTLFDDDSDLIFGTDSDWVIDCDTAKTLDIIPVTTDETSVINIGANTQGADFKLFGATTGEYILWDASADTLTANCGNVLFTGTDAEANQFKVDATGTVAGVAIQLETTTGGISILADGATQGDIAIDAEDDITITAAGDLTLAVTGTVSAGGAAITNSIKPVEVFTANDTLTAAESGKVCVSAGKGTPGDLVFTLPAAAAGLTFTFIDANATAADDLWITAGTGDTINGGTAAKSYKCTGDAVKQTVTITAGDATSWYITSELGTWANDNN